MQKRIFLLAYIEEKMDRQKLIRILYPIYLMMWLV